MNFPIWQRQTVIKTILPNTLITLPSDKTISIGDNTDIIISVVGPGLFSQKWLSHPDIKCDTCPLINVRPTTTTKYFITSQSDNGCRNMDSIKVIVINISGPTLVVSNDTIVCTDGTATLQILNYNPNYTYIWDKKCQGTGLL